MTHVPRNLCTGPWFQNTGFGSSTGHWLLPEETLLMVSSGRIELLDEDGFAMGVLGAWGACIESAGGVNAYLVGHSVLFANRRYTPNCDALDIMCFDLDF